MATTAAHKATLMRWYDGKLTPDELVGVMSSDPQWFPTRTVAKGGLARLFPARDEILPELEIHDHGRTFDLYDYLALNAVAGLLVVKDGAIAAEIYQRGVGRDTLWHSCSMAKSVSSTLVGVALREGAIDSIDDPVARYVDAGAAYRDISLRQLLRMCTGVAWSEDYADPGSERRRLLEVQTRWQADGIIDFMRSLPPPSSRKGTWSYNTGESYLVGAVLEKATGMPLADYLSEKIWSRIGTAQDARWWCESPQGMTISGSGMNACLPDYARFGQFVLERGIVDGEALLPEGWFQEAGRSHTIDGATMPYGYMWWIPPDDDRILHGSFQAVGIYGQFLHINPAERLVVLVASVRSKPSYRQRLEISDNAFFAAVARSLSGSCPV